jgi:ubiquitin-like-conjugating enzyme ATG3
MDEKISEMTLEETRPSIPKFDKDLEDDEDDEEAADMEAFEVSGMLDEQDKVSFLIV